MGENEQGGMLRTVVVIGIIAMVALIITLGVVGLKNNMSKNTDSAVGTVVMTKVPYTVQNADVDYVNYPPATDPWGLGQNVFTFPIIGDIPANSWREVRMEVESNKRTWIKLDINTNYKVSQLSSGNSNNYDAIAYRQLLIYDNNGNLIQKANDSQMASGKIYLEKDTNYVFVIKYYNDKGEPLVEDRSKPDWHDLTMLYTGVDDSSAYNFKVKAFEAATYDNKYVN